MQTRQARRPLVLALGLAALALATAPAPAQEGAALFDVPVVLADDQHRFETLLDLDGDGFADALDWWWVDDDYDTVRIHGWLNDGTGRLVQTWTLEQAVPGSSTSYFIEAGVGDVNGDSLQDFALAFYGKAYVYGSNGASAPSLLHVIDNGSLLESMVMADFGGDGRDDIALSDGWVTVYLNVSATDPVTGFVAAEPEWNTIGALNDHLEVIDADGDGDPDLANVRGTLVDFYLLEDGLWQSEFSVVHGLGSDPDVIAAVGDVDGDLDEDVAVFRNDTVTVVVLENRGNGLFAPGPMHVGGPATHLADVTGDGLVDGVCCGGGGGDPYAHNSGASKFEIAVNQGDGTFAPSFSIPNVGAHHIAGVADLDADGDADLVAGRTVYYARGPLEAPPWTALPTGAPLGSAGASPRLLTDCDGDGDPDVGYGSTGVGRNWGDGSLTLEPVSLPPAPGAAEGHRWEGPGTPGDFDGDGDVDLLVTRVSGSIFNPVFHANHLLRNHGSGVLSDAGPCTDGALNMSPGGAGSWDEPAASLAADVDADGDLDAVFTSLTLGGSSRLWLNDGDGVFTHGADFGGSVQAVAPITTDPQPDLIVLADQPQLWVGAGGGQFELRLTFPDDGTWDDDVAVIDENGDGLLDILHSPTGSNLIYVHRNNGDLTFTKVGSPLTATRLEPSAESKRLIVADVDGDGIEDLLAWPARYGGGSAWLVPGQPGEGFGTARQLCIEPTALADVDGDGDLDLFGQLDEIEADVHVAHLAMDGPGVGMREQYGYGTGGTEGVVPVFGATGPFRVGETIEIRFTGLPQGGFGILAVGFSPDALPSFPWQSTIGYVAWPWAFHLILPAVGGNVGEAGSAQLTLSFVANQSVASIGPIYHQGYWRVPGTSFGCTNGLMVDYE